MNTDNRKTYLDTIDISQTNQTAALLERFFYKVSNVDFPSQIPTEKVTTIEDMEVEEMRDRIKILFPKIMDFIVRTPEYKDDELDYETFNEMFSNLPYYIDSITAGTLAITLDKQEIFDSEKNFCMVVLESIQELKEPEIECDVVETKHTIDTSNLAIGMTIKNYKELCKLLCEEVKEGNSKKYQLEDFKCYFDWEKSGQKFIISDIYDTPLTKEDKRKLGNNSIYVQCIEVILLQFLSQQEGYKRTFTKRIWWEMLGIINHKYGRTSETELKKLDYAVTSWEVKHFYQRCNKKLEQILFSALNSLRNRRLITYEIQTVIVDNDGEYFEATDNQKKQILEMERYVLHDLMKCEKMIQIFAKFKQAEFYGKVNELLNENYGWDHYFKQVKVIYTPNGVREALPELEIKLQKELLNNKVVDCLNVNAQNIFDKKKAEYQQYLKNLIGEYWGEKPQMEVNKSKLWNPPDTYLSAQNILTNELIKIGHKDRAFSKEEFIESNSYLDEFFTFDK